MYHDVQHVLGKKEQLFTFIYCPYGAFFLQFFRVLCSWSTIPISTSSQPRKSLSLLIASTNKSFSLSPFLSYAVPSFRPYPPCYCATSPHPTPSALFSAFDKFSEFSTYSEELPLTMPPYLLPCQQEKHR